MVINTISNYIDTYSSVVNITYPIPAYSTVLNFFIDNNILYLVYSSDDSTKSEEKTYVNVQVNTSQYLNNFTPNYNFEYFTTIISEDNRLDSHSSGSNFSMNIIPIRKYFHIFVQENLSLREIRDKKLNQII